MNEFKVGDLVQLVDVAARSERYPARVGAVVGFARREMRVKVLWSSLEKPQMIHAALLKHADQRNSFTTGTAIRARSRYQPQILEWSPREDEQLRGLLSKGTGAAHVAKVLSRSEKAVRARARKLGVPSRRITSGASVVAPGHQSGEDTTLPPKSAETAHEAEI